MSAPAPVSLSILVPTRDRAPLLERAIRSVLADPTEGYELVVSDNASTDGTDALRARFDDPRVRWFRQETNLGMRGNWQFCVAQARGDRVLLLSDDDYVAPGFVAAVLARRDALRAASLAYTSCRIVRDGEVSEPVERWTGGRARWEGPEFLRAVLEGQAHLQLCSVLFERTHLLAHPFREDLRYAVDMAAWIGQVDDRGVLFVPDATAFYTLHAASVSTTLTLRERYLEDAAITRELVARLAGTCGGSSLRRLAARRNRAKRRHLARTAGLRGWRSRAATLGLWLAGALGR